VRWLRLDPELLRITKKLVKISILVMALVAIYMLFTYVFPILGKILSILPGLFLPFILALILAVLAEPVVELFELRLKFKRVWAVLLSLVLIIGGFLSVLSLLVSMVIKEMSDLYRAAISHSNQITAQVMETIRHFRIFYGQLHLPTRCRPSANGLVKALEGLQNLLSNSIDVLIQFFAVLPGLLVFIMIGTVATFFIIKDRALLRGLVIGIIPLQPALPAAMC
jgi:predicted PurR-regulated permease PerM